MDNNDMRRELTIPSSLGKFFDFKKPLNGSSQTGVDDDAEPEADDGDDGGSERPPKQADILIEFSKAADVFHSPDKVCFADVWINGHRETLPIRRKGFRSWLRFLFYQKTRSAPNSEAMQSAVAGIEGGATRYEAAWRRYTPAGGVGRQG